MLFSEPFTQKNKPFLTLALAMVLLIALFPAWLHAQGGDDPAAAEVLENFFRDQENANESDAQQFQELLDYRRTNPLDLNATTRDADPCTCKNNHGSATADVNTTAGGYTRGARHHRTAGKEIRDSGS
jgi:hypothetical protein